MPKLIKWKDEDQTRLERCLEILDSDNVLLLQKELKSDFNEARYWEDNRRLRHYEHSEEAQSNWCDEVNPSFEDLAIAYLI